MSKLWIFKPSDKWRYCGGGLVIIADSFEECQKLWDEKLYLTNEEIEGTYNTWIFVENFEITYQPSRIVMSDYNWG